MAKNTKEKKGNGQKGKSRLEIAQKAHEKAIAKAAATEERLEKAKEAGSVRAEKKKEAARKALDRAVLQCHNAGLTIVNTKNRLPVGEVTAEVCTE